MKKLLLVSAIAMGLAACGDNDRQVPDQDYQMTEAALASHIKTLASDEFGGRAPNTMGEELTVNYIEGAFRDAGLSPANGDSFIQQVPLVSIETLDNPVITINGKAGTLDLAYRADQVVWTRKEQADTSVAGSEMVFVGYGITAPERGWDDYAGVDVTGKTVVILVNDPGFATQDPALFNGNAMTYYGRWTYKFEEAARQGAAAAIIIHDTKPAAYPWATVESSWTGPQFDMVHADKGASLSPVEAWITTDAADRLFALAGLDRKKLTNAAVKPGFKAVPMRGLALSTSFKSDIAHVTSRNVAGLVEGTDHPDEVFIYMAHWDHLGTDPTKEGDQIYNGALDNATGTAGLIELARAYAGAVDQPKRSVMFLAVTAEEQGLLGSAYYAANPLVPLENTVGGINMDGLNNYGPTRDVNVIGLGNSELDDYIKMAADARGRVLVPDQEPEKGYFYRSDHFELSKLGVPMLYPNAGYDHIEKGRAYVEELSAAYLANDYHKPSDEFSDSWVLSGAIDDLTLYYETGRLVINGSIWPNWREGTEFKALRDQQRAGK